MSYQLAILNQKWFQNGSKNPKTVQNKEQNMANDV